MGLFMIKNNLLRLIVCLLLDVLVIYALAKFGLIDDIVRLVDLGISEVKSLFRFLEAENSIVYLRSKIEK